MAAQPRASEVSLFVYDKRIDMLVLNASNLEFPIRVKPGQGIAGHVFKTHETVNIPNCYEDSRFDQTFDKSTGYRTNNLLTMRIIDYEGEGMGVLQAINKLDGTPFTHVDEILLENLAELRELAEAVDSVPTFPSQETAPRAAGKGKGSLRSGVRKRLAADVPVDPGYDGPADMDDDDFTSDEYLRQVCREEFQLMRGTITSEVSSSVSKTVGENHTTFLTMLSAMQAEVAKQATAVEQQVQSALAPRLDAVSRRLQTQIDEHTAQLFAAQTRLDRHDSDIESLRDQVAELRKQLALAAAAPRDEQPPPTSFERAEVQAPPGSDKSPKRIKLDITHRKVRQAVELQYPGRSLFSDKERGVLSLGWDKFMQLQVAHGDTPPKLFWDTPVLSNHGMDEEALRAACRDITHQSIPTLRLATRNARALLQAGGDKARIKKAYLSSIRPRSTIIALQEIHQDHRQLVSFIAAIANDISVYSSFDQDPVTGHTCGGVAMLVSPLAGSSGVFPTTAQRVLIPGRARVVTISSASHSVDILNILNRELSHADIRHAVEAIKASRLRAQEGPDMYATFVLGDFNFAVHDALALALPVAAVRRGDRRHHGQEPRWREALARLAEVACEDPSHFEQSPGSCSSIDRISCSLSGWQMCQVHSQVSTIGTPEVISAVVNHATRPALQALAPPCQRGRVLGRNFGVNILELDVSSRNMFVTPHASRDIPVLLSLDVGQAFPSLNQDFPMSCLGLLGLPGPLAQFVASIYSSIEGVALHRGHLERVFWIQSGIIQGCPLSGTLRALGASAFLVDLAEKADGPQLGRVRACADDIGGALRSAQALSKAPAREVRGAIERDIPEWVGFEITSRLLYLGLWPGSAASPATSWIGPLSKLRLRAQAIGRGTTPASHSAILYNTRAVTTLSCVAQFCWPPKSVLLPELSVLAQVFRPPLGALHFDAGSQLDRSGGPRCIRWGHLATATITRAATLTFQRWPQLLAALRAHADEHPDWATLDMLATGPPYPNFWKAPAFVENLEAAAAVGTAAAPVLVGLGGDPPVD
ncbi:unnamed protein product [Prorocentrum cordatum]|uniref:Reverse transcriptase domain-containing protein n=1 Tax=Prorocentrum cordatum TaxID=2364126 RepID=A0ABN9UQT7_9DINO|nr:unnamed protein product [Polarella glacialis]